MLEYEAVVDYGGAEGDNGGDGDAVSAERAGEKEKAERARTSARRGGTRHWWETAYKETKAQTEPSTLEVKDVGQA